MVLWIWSVDHWEEVEVESACIDRVMVAAGVAPSRTEAQRLISQGAVYTRESDSKKPLERITDFRSEVEGGWPVDIKVGYRTVTVMRPVWMEGVHPEEGPYRVFQTREVWDDVWRV